MFTGNAQPQWVVPITSVNEDVLLKRMGLGLVERMHIEGLRKQRGATNPSISSREPEILTEDQQVARAVVRLATNPPVQVGDLQRRTCTWFLRPYPLGLRFSGKNMSPLPGFLSGAQGICLNQARAPCIPPFHGC